MADMRSRLAAITASLEALAAETQRPVARLVAVSKTMPVAVLAEAHALGLRRLGENYVNEIIEKAPQLPADVEWHFIGTLQSNKVKPLLRGVPGLAYVESVSSAKVASLLDKHWAQEHPGTRLNVLVQINTSGEDNKDGVEAAEAPALVAHVIDACPNLAFRGLMTIGRPGDVSCFDALAQLRDKLASELGGLPAELELSMGMSADYAEAVRRGATSVRIGSSLFGARPPKT